MKKTIFIIIFFFLFSFETFSMEVTDFSKKIDIIYGKIENINKDKTYGIKIKNYNSLINLFKKYNLKYNNNELSIIINGVIEKLEYDIYNYVNIIDTGDCNLKYSLSNSNSKGKCECSYGFEFDKSFDGTILCKQINNSNTYNIIDYNSNSFKCGGFIAKYDFVTNSCKCPDGYFYGKNGYLETCVLNSNHPKIINKGIFVEDLYFGKYKCTIDCSGHIAGYEWSKNKKIYNINNCGGNSQSFIEGCYEYVNDYLNK